MLHLLHSKVSCRFIIKFSKTENKFINVFSSIKRTLSKINNGGFKKRAATFVIISFLAMFLSFIFAGARVVYKVNYKGKNIATVTKKEQVSKAVSTVVEIVNSKGVEVAVEDPEIVPVVAVNSEVDSEKTVVTGIIDNTDEIVEATSLIIDGQKVLVGDSREILKLMDEYLDKFNIPETECESRFVQEVLTEKGYFLSNELKTAQDINKILSTLTVETVAKTVEINDIPFSKVVQKDSEKPYGTTETLIEGKVGKSSKVTKVVYLDGKPMQSELVSEDVLIAPQDEIELLGQKVKTLTVPSAQPGEALESGFVFPLPSKTWTFVAPFGDGRNHKGVDLAAKEGTAIMAAAGGKVIYSGWRSGYGNCVEIEHGNGITTRYAHASALFVENGEYVEAGTVIAAVGTTGDSYGFHLHFEIRTHDNPLNPAPYLGLK